MTLKQQVSDCFTNLTETLTTFDYVSKKGNNLFMKKKQEERFLDIPSYDHESGTEPESAQEHDHIQTKYLVLLF